jgi:hypothetical protein
MRWAEERQAQPATVGEDGGEARVLRLDFPGYGGGELRHISWDEWFQPFDERNLTFLFQEHKKDGAQSNFFQLDNPEREDG